ncbi:MAG: hypothetical protein ACLVAK_07685 [Clostridia bacterium]
MDLQDRYDDLENLESSLQVLLDETIDKDYKEELEDMLTRVQIDKEAIEPKVQEMQEREYKEQERQYERSVL